MQSAIHMRISSRHVLSFKVCTVVVLLCPSCLICDQCIRYSWSRRMSYPISHDSPKGRPCVPRIIREVLVFPHDRLLIAHNEGSEEGRSGWQRGAHEVGKCCTTGGGRMHFDRARNMIESGLCILSAA
ncbi:hypothetical protein EDD17DRAFT_1672427 [Pisolithus thermaeus]|nr:hypothetical protein EDD17DRAFT_1672427 [Pisolithus thermaeus]